MFWVGVGGSCSIGEDAPSNVQAREEAAAVPGGTPGNKNSNTNSITNINNINNSNDNNNNSNR